ncbi:MAG: hypothetical protein KJO83_06960 [Bacteroidia bacterium]|nr:hypothetical protein [Bacteroidia bacterium]
MKRTLILITLFSLVFTSCNKSVKKDQNDSSPMVEYENLQEKSQDNTYNLSNDWVNDIELDNNSKWQANVESTQGVNAMLDLIKKSDLKTIEDYYALGVKLNEEKNTIIKECTMTGPSHDNLHIFLLPLVEKIDYLSTATTKDEASKIMASIIANLNAYKNYFN